MSVLSNSRVLSPLLVHLNGPAPTSFSHPPVHPHILLPHPKQVYPNYRTVFRTGLLSCNHQAPQRKKNDVVPLLKFSAEQHLTVSSFSAPVHWMRKQAPFSLE